MKVSAAWSLLCDRGRSNTVSYVLAEIESNPNVALKYSAEIEYAAESFAWSLAESEADTKKCEHCWPLSEDL